jgi:hypothetical protein
MGDGNRKEMAVTLTAKPALRCINLWRVYVFRRFQMSVILTGYTQAN